MDIKTKQARRFRLQTFGLCLIALLFETDIWDKLSWTKEYFFAQILMEFFIMISFTKSIHFISDVSLKSPYKEYNLYY